MRILAFILLLTVVFLTAPQQLPAQEVTIKRSSIIENYKGKAYYIHFVTQGETLTALSKAYEISIDEIVAENQFVEKGLKADMVLRIPQKSSDNSQKTISNVTTTEVSKAGESQKEVIQKPDEPGYAIYLVKKQETLYGISKQFGVTVDDILNANPGFEGLKEGMKIKIPSKTNTPKTTAVNAVEINNKKETIPTEIVVNTGETLYSISKKYNKTVDELIELNPQLSSGLKAGMTIKLQKDDGNVKDLNISKPVEKVNTAGVKPSVTSDCYNSVNLSKTYQVAFLLPFLLDESAELVEAPVEKSPAGFENFNYMQFYAGFMLAADSLEKLGLRAKIQVFDAERLNDTLVIRQTLRKPGLEKVDLIVGPLYASSFTIAARFAKKNQIGIVNPLSRRESIVEGNPFVIKSQVSNAGMAAKLYSFITNNHPEANVIMVRQDNKEMKLLADSFKEAIKKGAENKEFKGILQESVYSTESIGGVTKKLKPGLKNIIIFFSNNGTSVPNFVSLLNPSAKTSDIILVGMEGWDEMNLETEFLVNLNYHLLSSAVVDFSDEGVKEFSKVFKRKYGAVPLSAQHAFLGYDLGWYFLTSLMWYGDNYLTCLPSNQGSGLQYNFSFVKQNPEDGFQNTNISVFKLQDYKLVPVK